MDLSKTRSGDFKGFIHAVMNENVDEVSYYISIGMDVNFLHPEIMTNPLIEAVKVGNIEIIQLLLENGANPKIISQLGESALTVAKNKDDRKLIELLRHKRSYLSRFISFSKKLTRSFFPSSLALKLSSNRKESS